MSTHCERRRDADTRELPRSLDTVLANYHAKRDGPLTKIGSRGPRLICSHGHRYADHGKTRPDGRRFCSACEPGRKAITA